MLDKLGGKYAPMPSSGPHKKTECIPLCVLLTRKLKVATSTKEVKYILRKNMVEVNGIVRTDKDYPLGIMDVLKISNQNYRVLYNVNRKFVLHKISEEEGSIRLAKVSKKMIRKKDVPYVYCNDGSTFRYCNPQIKARDTLIIDISTKSVIDFIPFKVDEVAFITKGKNLGCVGTITSIEKHEGGYDIAYIRDSTGRNFATRTDNAIVIGSRIELPNGNGIKISELEKSNARYGEIVAQEVAAEDE